jgi:pimeloyl-ACP methyl ester carboxylesterase
MTISGSLFGWKSVVVMGVFAGTLQADGVNFGEVSYRSNADDSMQSAMFYDPKPGEPVPLVVALHTWSGDFRQEHHKPIREWCMKKGWAYIHPDFRGPARRPEATGSDLVVGDIVSAVKYARNATRIQGDAVFLVGTSGGGYHCLVMAGRHPELFAGISAWASISDLKAWYHENLKSGRRYWSDIVKSCGGKPGDSPAVDEQYRKRSPLHYLKNAKGRVPLHIATGITDGHNGSVPISHSLLAFNEVSEIKDRVGSEEIAFMTREARLPDALQKADPDQSFGGKQPIFRRSSATATVTIFDGGHEIIQPAAIAWMESLYAERK